MDEQHAKKVRAMAYGAARKRLGKQDAEDAAQYIMLNYIRKGHESQTLKQGVTDWMRANLGNRRTEEGTRRKQDREKPVHLVPLSQLPKRLAEQELLHFESQVAKFPSESRTFLVLHYMWGMTQREIGYAFGVSEAYVNVKIKKAEREMRK